MPDSCIRRRLLFACRQTYGDAAPPKGTPVGWTAEPAFLTAGPNGIDRALIGRVDAGIVLAFRGTLAPFQKDSHGSGQVARDWFNNVEFLSRDNPVYPGRVHKGFAQSVDALWGQIVPAIQGLIKPGGPNALFVTGHSKGGALANLAAWRALGIHGLDAPIRVFTIAAARAGNADFRTAYQAHGGIRCRRYEYLLDIVPLVPPGADTPGWAKPLIAAAWPHLADNNYAGVGTRVPAATGLVDRLQALRHYFGAFGMGSLKGDYLPLLAAAHSIGANSDYDKMICDGEPGCTHD
ncbi:MAG TPA: lipase family protein [Allosphingosinicella sp.]|nr:lipase family protein [Allosphingosinicella sp.]